MYYNFLPDLSIDSEFKWMEVTRDDALLLRQAR